MRNSLLKHFLLFVFIFVFCLSHVYSAMDFEKEINRLSQEIAQKIAGAGKKKIAVVDFTDLSGGITELGRFLAEEFSVALAGTGKGFTVVDRIHLQTILKEHKLSATGLIDQNTARDLGKIAGVEALITGSLTPMGESVRVSVKVLDTETAVLIDASRGNIAMTDAIKGLMERQIGATLIPGSTGNSEISKVKVKPVRSVEEFGFIFQAIECKITGKKVMCSVLITNKEDDRRLKISFSRTNLNDDFGNQYSVTKAQIGTVVVIPGSWNHSIERTLFSGVPTKAIFTFEDVSPQAKMASALVLFCHSFDESGRKEFSVKLRNIPFSK
ncbi:MAG: hypothetical protein KAT34_14305 [Candidatus Aminicenantes bacterium]|nr:hypothetical protein [Candidatus Aminicenantes bacterium]